jgi:hypothetical protein
MTSVPVTLPVTRPWLKTVPDLAVTVGHPCNGGARLVAVVRRPGPPPLCRTATGPSILLHQVSTYILHAAFGSALRYSVVGPISLHARTATSFPICEEQPGIITKYRPHPTLLPLSPLRHLPRTPDPNTLDDKLVEWVLQQR